MNKTDQLKTTFYTSLLPPPDITVDEWADQKRILSSESSSEPGPWRTARFPFMREVMKVISPQDPTEEVVLMAGAQVAKTENDLNLMGYHIDLDPCPILYMQKTVDSVEKFSKQRFSKSLEVTPEVADKLSPSKSRDSSNTILVKSFTGGIILMGGANSAASLRSMPIRVLLLDEIDSYELDIQSEGDPIELAKRRTSNFPNRKIFYTSTPLIKETSRIEPLFEEGDQRKYYVPCPYCKFKQVIEWDNLKYEVKEMGISYKIISVNLKCISCQKLIPERYKTQMLEGGEWIAKNPGVDIVSFHINSLYSPLGFFSWRDVVKLWMKYKRSRAPEHLKVFVTTVLGETFSATGKNVDYSLLSSHKSFYPTEVPEGVKILVIGADVQDDRIECELLGIGDYLETWSISYKRFMGDPEESFVWQQFDDFTKRSWLHESGLQMYPMGVAVDSGYKAKKVYSFCKAREHRRFMPVKGTSGWGKGLVNRPMNRNKEGAWLHAVYVDEMKAKIFSHLKLDKPGAGYCHFPDKPEYDENYFMMLTAERLEKKKIVTTGQMKLVWTLIKNRRNEALDCRGYAIAMAFILYPDADESITALPGPVSPQMITSTRKKRKKGVVSKGVEF